MKTVLIAPPAAGISGGYRYNQETARRGAWEYREVTSPTEVSDTGRVIFDSLFIYDPSALPARIDGSASAR